MAYKTYKRFFTPVLDLLRQGVTTDKLALSLALGLCLSCFPLFGATTILCTVAAIALRANLPAIQLANYTAAPLQILLLIPFIRMGEKLFRSERLPLSASQLAARFHASPLGALSSLWRWEWHAMVAWLLLAVPVFLLLYPALKTGLSKIPSLDPVPEDPPEMSADPRPN